MASSTTPATAAPAQRAANQTNSIAIAMFCVLLVSYVLMAADRYLFPVLAPDVRRAFGFSLSNTGLLSTIFTLGIGLAGLPTGYLLARFSRKTVLLIGIAIFSSATALTTIASGFFSMLVFLAAQGIGMSMLATSMFALAANYFSKSRTAAIGSVNFCYGIGGFLGPFLTGILRTNYASSPNPWHAPMLYFGAFGFVMIAVIMATVRPWLSETQQAAQSKADTGGAETLMNRNTIILTILSLIHGLSMYGFLGLYPTFLRENLHYTPAQAGTVIGFFGIGALTSIAGGWLGDRLPAKLMLSGSLLVIAALGYLFFMPDFSMVTREILTCIYGIAGSAVLYVNLAGCHVKSLRRSLSSKGSGMFVTSLYAGAAFGGYFLGALASSFGWQQGSEISMTAMCLIGAVLAVGIRPSEMSV
jgi:DHA1 family inner membrane transport protein